MSTPFSTSPERLTVNGVDMKTLAKNVETLAATLRVPAFKTRNQPSGGRHGSVYTPNKRYDELVLTWPMWVQGCTDQGAIPSTSSAAIEFYKNLDALISLMTGSQDSLLEIKHYLPNGKVRTNYAEVIDVIDFSTDGKFARVNFTLVFPYPFWVEDGSPYVLDVTLGSLWAPTVYELTGLAGCNAPIEDAVLEVWSPSDSMIFKSGGSMRQTQLWIKGTSYDIDDYLLIDSGTGKIRMGDFQWYYTRFNRHMNPSLETDATGYAIASGTGGAISRQSAGVKPVRGSWYGQTIIGSAGVAHVRCHDNTAANFSNVGYQIGVTYTWSVWVRLGAGSPSASTSAAIRVRFFNGSAVDIGGADGTSTPLTRSTNDTTDIGAWKRLSVTLAVPAGTASVSMEFITPALATNDKINWDGCLVEETSTLQPFFDGGSPACTWAGTVNNSRSLKRSYLRANVHNNPSVGSGTTGFSNNGGVGTAPVRTTTGVTIDNGADWLRVTAGSNGNVNVFLHPFTHENFFAMYEAGRQYTWSVYVRVYGGTVGSTRNVQLAADFYNGSTYISTSSASAVCTQPSNVNNLADWVRISFTATVPANCNNIGLQLIGISLLTNEGLHIDCIMIEPDLALGTYLDGNTVGANWNGTAELSDSYIPNIATPASPSDITNYDGIEYTGVGSYIELAPAADGKYYLELAGNNLNARGETRFRLTAKRKFKTG